MLIPSGARSAFSALLCLVVTCVVGLSGCSSCVGALPAADAGTKPGDGGAARDGGAVDAGRQPVGDAGPVQGGALDGGSSGPGDGGTAGPILDGGLSADAGNGDAGHTLAPDAGPACAMNSQCSLGELCRGGECVPGCEDDRDCPSQSPFCDVTLGPQGACAACLQDTDCPGAGEACVDGRCAAACSAENPACPDDLLCDEASGLCVDCRGDSDCPLGQICERQVCEAGCRENRDCPNDLVCGPDQQCIEGCTTSPTDSCPLGMHCDTGACVVGCNGDDARCGEGRVCVLNEGRYRCGVGCMQSDECPNGRACVDGTCQVGCTTNADCGQFTPRPVCLLESGASLGACVQCTADNECPLGRCDLATNSCRLSCPQPGCFGGTVCDVATDLCVECLSDDDCDDGDTCDLGRRECVTPPAALCGDCTTDADCAGNDNLCVRRQLSNFIEEAFCAQDCRNTSCPQGFACVQVGAPVVRGLQCIPASSVLVRPTCGAIQDLWSGRECAISGQCGVVLVDDGYCAPTSPNQPGFCTMACAVDTDCPETYRCGPAPMGAPMGLPGICEPAP